MVGCPPEGRGASIAFAGTAVSAWVTIACWRARRHAHLPRRLQEHLAESAHPIVLLAETGRGAASPDQPAPPWCASRDQHRLQLADQLVFGGYGSDHLVPGRVTLGHGRETLAQLYNLGQQVMILVLPWPTPEGNDACVCTYGGEPSAMGAPESQWRCGSARRQPTSPPTFGARSTARSLAGGPSARRPRHRGSPRSHGGATWCGYQASAPHHQQGKMAPMV